MERGFLNSDKYRRTDGGNDGFVSGEDAWRTMGEDECSTSESGDGERETRSGHAGKSSSASSSTPALFADDGSGFFSVRRRYFAA